MMALKGYGILLIKLLNIIDKVISVWLLNVVWSVILFNTINKVLIIIKVLLNNINKDNEYHWWRY